MGVAVEEAVNSEKSEKLESQRHSTMVNQGKKTAFYRSRESLGLLLSCLLAELHGGEISVHGSPEAGYSLSGISNGVGLVNKLLMMAYKSIFNSDFRDAIVNNF